MPVRLTVGGRETDAARATDVMVAPENASDRGSAKRSSAHGTVRSAPHLVSDHPSPRCNATNCGGRTSASCPLRHQPLTRRALRTTWPTAAEPHRLGPRLAVGSCRRPVAATQSRSASHAAVRRSRHRSLGTDRTEALLRRPGATRSTSTGNSSHPRMCAMRSSRSSGRGGWTATRCIATCCRAARPRHAARRCAGRPR